MKIEIWSDFVCPFCYIGKRKLEKALKMLKGSEGMERIEKEWKSYQLNPNVETDEKTSTADNLAIHKGISKDQAENMIAQVSRMAETEGLKYDLENAVTANTFTAHRMSHFAKEHGKQDEVEEALFRAYFSERKNIDNPNTLVQIGKEAGLEEDALRKILEGGDFTEKVNEDIREAQILGVRGVPFFLFNRKYAVSGAQPVEVFLQTLEKAQEEERNSQGE